jgi:3-polyprenyl-4-hydroxybenzoate decarboxylase
MRAAEAAFRGHGSLKHVVVVDDDIDIADPVQVEWALATRFQADRGMKVMPDQPGSSLDPSGRHAPGQKSRTTKLALDATIPWLHDDGSPRSPQEINAFRRNLYQTIDTGQYLENPTKDV